ncbi:MAG: hypothetical protein K2H15_02085, partial [Muribaculaceae bacterium]|nr:hypothetical protein [Muribaculaceae bacterium]
MSIRLPYPEDNYRLFIFNPETDYALASGSLAYNPPAVVKALRRHLALLPAYMARERDAVVILDSPGNEPDEELRSIVARKGIDIVALSDCADYVAERMEKEGKAPIVTPWGWNHSLRKTLRSAGLAENLLIGKEALESFRNISHRRSTIDFYRMLSERLDLSHIEIPRECNSTDEALGACAENEISYLKAPWSSSGRGVVTTESLSPDRLKEWISGCIRRQGSVMVEKGYDRTGDFASEWWIENGNARFMGLSMFNTSKDGRYGGNAFMPDEEIERRIISLSPQWSREIIEAQK